MIGRRSLMSNGPCLTCECVVCPIVSWLVCLHDRERVCVRVECSWYVATVVNADVTTDDTYQYVNAVAKVKPYVLAYNTNEDTSPLQTEIAEVSVVMVMMLTS